MRPNRQPDWLFKLPQKRWLPDWGLALVPTIWIWGPHSWLAAAVAFLTFLYVVSALGWFAFAYRWEIRWFLGARIVLVVLSVCFVTLRGSIVCHGHVSETQCAPIVNDTFLLLVLLPMLALCAGIKIWCRNKSRRDIELTTYMTLLGG